MEVIAILAGVAFAVNKTISVLKAAKAGDWNTPITQAVVWVVSIVAVVLICHAKLTADATIPGLAVTFGSLDSASQVLLGWVLGGSGSFAFDFTKVLDNTQSNAEPSLLARPGGSAQL